LSFETESAGMTPDTDAFMLYNLDSVHWGRWSPIDRWSRQKIWHSLCV